MIAAWMLYTTLVAALLAAAAHAFERGCRLVRLPGRWPWAAALLLALLVPLAATRPEATMTAQPRARAARGAGPESAREQPPQTSALARVPAVVVVPPGTPLAALDRPLLALWLVASFGWCVVLAGSAIRLAGRETTWRPLVVDGVPVLVSHDVGPALVGVLTPRIVLPAWTLELPRERRALVIAHEREHALARDPLLLLAGAVAVAIAPWNAALWYAFARLRLAVEADCDSRVLRSRPDVRAYGSVLLDVSARAVAGAAPVAALAESATQLSRRLDLITARPVRFVALRLGGAALASLTLAALACRTPQPTVAASPTALMAARPAQFDSLQRELAAMIPHLDTISREVAQITAAMPRLARRQREMATEMHLRGTPDSTLRRAVAEHYPAALAGGVGREPMLWFVVDARNVVLRTATGRDGLSRWSPARVRDSMQMFLLSMSDSARAEAETHGIEYLDVKAARRKFPELRRAGAEPDFMQWSSVHAGPDTVSVIWIRLRPGATLR